MVRRFLILTLTFLFLTEVSGQSLARKGSIGIYFSVTNDSLTNLLGLKQPGLLVQEIVAKSTAETLDLRIDDVILSLNGQRMTNNAELFDYGLKILEGDQISIDIMRDGKQQLVSGRALPKPKETSGSGEVIYGSVSYTNGILRSISHKPKGPGPFPTLFYIQGHDCSSIDMWYDDQALIRQFTDALVKRGVAVFRMEKAGVGDSRSEVPCEQMGFNDEVELFKQGYKTMRDLPWVDDENSFLFGHSMGGIIAPLIAKDYPVKGIVVYGTVARSWYEYMITVYREQKRRMGMDPGQLEDQVRLASSIFYDYLVEKRPVKDLFADPSYKDLLESGKFGFTLESLHERSHTFDPELNDIDVTNAWKNANTYVLALYGEHDLHAIDKEDTRAIAAIVNEYHPGRGEWQVIEKTDHGMVRVPSMKEYLRLREAGDFDREYINANFNLEVVLDVYDWMKSVGGFGTEATSLLGQPLKPMTDSPKSRERKDRQLFEAKQNYEHDPVDLENIIWYGRRLAYLGRYQDAIAIYSKGLEQHPHAAELYRHRGHRYVSIRKFDNAISDFNTAVENMQGRPLEIEADGMPNKQNIPLSNLQFNVWYHLGLAYYLKADFTNAILAYENCLAFCDNDDLVTATADWLYMSYMRNGESVKAAILLDQINPDMNIIENDAYFKRLLMYKGLIKPEELLAFDELDEENELSIVTQGYGVGNYYSMKGETEKARKIFERILKSNYWSAFGYIAAEAEISRYH